MSRIKVLPQTLINQIAAGEVVVRMASVVKELVENAIDAGATRIEVLIANDGRDVEVRDDGCGMNRDDAELCLQRHATSKIRTVEDLAAIATRGFRGEAMPSIASVSRMEIQTREARAQAGTRIVVEGGRILRIETVGCPPGTRVIVRDLFFNTPARLKFLKSAIAEVNAIVALVTRHSLATPAIGFRVERDGQEVFTVPPEQAREHRFADVLGSQLQRDLLPVTHRRDGVVVAGHIAHPLDGRGDRRHQYFFVNGRPFTSKPLSAALEQACRGFVMVARFPVCCIFVDVPAGDVDINVHPTKEEVRFRDERNVAGAVYRAAQEALEGNRGLVGEVQFPRAPDPEPAPPSIQGDAPAQSAPPRAPDRPPGFFTSPDRLVQHAFNRKKGRAMATDWVAQAERFQNAAPAGPASPPPTAPAAPAAPVPPGRALPRAAHGDGSLVAAGPGESPDHDFWARGYDPEPLGQIAETYIIARFGEDMLIIDQHASHERLRYLELKRRPVATDAQRLLVPITIDVTPVQESVLRHLTADLAALGFELSPFGPRTWAVESLPADLPEMDPVPMLLEMIDDFEDARRTNALEDLRDRILIRAACHSAIRAGDRLSMAKMTELLRQVKAERLALTCPHGRPTIVRLAKGELDRQFKRIV